MTFTTCLHWDLLFSSPFDVEDMTTPSGTGNKAVALQRRMSIYSQGTPETPIFKDHSFFVSSMGFLEKRYEFKAVLTPIFAMLDIQH